MQKIIQIHPYLLKLLRKQESVTDGQTAAIIISPTAIAGGIIINKFILGVVLDSGKHI